MPRGFAVLGLFWGAEVHRERAAPDGMGETRRLAVGGFGGFSVVFDVGLGSFGRVMHCVMVMTACKVRVMRGEMMFAGFVVARGFAMMVGGVVMMFGGFVVVLNGVFGHKVLLRYSKVAAGRA